MDIFFQDPTAIPLPPDEVRVKDLRAAPWQDNRRVGIYLEVTPFQKRPNADITIHNPSGQVVATASIVETMITKMELTMHLRGAVDERRIHHLRLGLLRAGAAGRSRRPGELHRSQPPPGGRHSAGGFSHPHHLRLTRARLKSCTQPYNIEGAGKHACN